MSLINLPPSLVALTKLLAITSSAFLAGSTATYSFLLVPSISTNPTAKTEITAWRRGYVIGFRVTPPQCLVAGLSWLALALSAPSKAARWSFLFAAVLVPSILPYTLTVQRPVNGALTRRAVELAGEGEGTTAETYASTEKRSADYEKGKSTEELVQAWGRFNMVRAGIVGLGTVVGGWAALGGVDG